MGFIKFFLYFGILSSCASMEPHYKFCKDTNWQALGTADAKSDKSMDHSFQSYKNRCKHFDDDELKPDLTMYQHGHFVGVKDFCTNKNGFEYGLSQKITSTNCDNQKFPEFYKGIADGVKAYCSYENGLKNGQEGEMVNKVCSQNDHPPYYKGIMAGNKVYCTYVQGVKMGSEDKKYTGVCKNKGEEDFLRGHIVGMNQSEIVSLKKQIRNFELENVKLKEQLTQKSEAIIKLEAINKELNEKLEKIKAN